LPDKALQTCASFIVLIHILIDQPIGAPGPRKGGARDIRLAIHLLP
jgi:hypothetical protein